MPKLETTTTTKTEAGMEDDGEEEEFYESVDRILSSSCSSTSASDEDTGTSTTRRRRGAAPSSSTSSPYDVWIAEPTSVEERRRLLLLRMGLTDMRAPPPQPATPPPHTAPPITKSDSNGSESDKKSKPPLSPLPRNGSGSGSGSEQLRIKNLDDGTEFEVGPDEDHSPGPPVREIRTGRQLTIEEFELCVGRSPIVHELMRRTTTATDSAGAKTENSKVNNTTRTRKKTNLFRSIKHMAGNVAVVAGYRHRSNGRSSGDDKEKNADKEKADDSLGSAAHNAGGAADRIRVRQYGKSCKELTGVFLTQEVKAHTGAIWCIKFSLDGKYLASAGEDWVINVWEVSDMERKAELFGDTAGRESGGSSPFLAVLGSGSPEMALSLSCIEGSYGERKRRPRMQSSRKSVGSDHLIVPEHVFALAEKPVCSLKGHAADVLDLSWSKSQYLLSSSMDKTVKLWNITSPTCLKTFSHSDYVTCIQFNPVDDKFFISGSLDEKVRVWSVPDRQVVDWNDLHEMVTAACYSPDGQGALVGSHKGSCHSFDTSENKLQYKSQIDLRIKKKKSSQKKITGFQFSPGSSSEVIITSADSRIRVVNGDELVHKFKGFRNTSSQISASIAPNGKYVICASEDSHVYVWRHDESSQPTKSKGPIESTSSYEHFHCQDVTVATTWPGAVPSGSFGSRRSNQSDLDGLAKSTQEFIAENNELGAKSNPVNDSTPNTSNQNPGDKAAATLPEEKLVPTNSSTDQGSSELSNGAVEVQSRTAWGLVIVTAGRGGEIRVFQNFGFPVNV